MDLTKVYNLHATHRSCVLNYEETVTTLYLSPAEAAGPSQICTLTACLTIHPDNEPAIKGKQRMLSELKEDVKFKFAGQFLHPETKSSGQVSTQSELFKSLNRILFGLSALSKIIDGASKVCYLFRSHY